MQSAYGGIEVGVRDLTEEVVWAYTAGVFDGEGNVHMGITNRKYCTVQCVIRFTNNSKELIDWIANQLKTGFIIHQDRHLEHHQTHYRLEVKRQKEIVRVLERMTPYLIVKKAEAELALEWAKKHIPYQRRTPKRRCNGQWEKGQLIDRVWELEVYKKMRLIKPSNKNWKAKEAILIGTT